jgi:ATP-dependent RNA circularization protein (DNA/RNA ligase family)
MMQKLLGLDQKPRRVSCKINGIRCVPLSRLCLFPYNRRSRQQMTLKEAQLLTLRVLKQVMEEKLDQHNVQLAQVRFFICSVIRRWFIVPQVTPTNGFEILNETKLKEVIEAM